MVVRPLMIGLIAAFAVMSGLYISALGLGPAGNAIFLQNTAPLWLCVIGAFLLGDTVGWRGWQAVALGAAGAVVIVVGNWPRDLPPQQQQLQVVVLLMGLGSGIVYATVVLLLRALRDCSSAWLVLLCHVGSACVIGVFVFASLGPTAWLEWLTMPSPRQLALLAVFGTVQMALPYWLFSRGLRTVSAQEAGIITLIEPLLNPVWAYLITPATDTPTVAMLIGGLMILGALVWRYVPVTVRRE
jgi:drug/metabolite transporter (DMT)-like permease